MGFISFSLDSPGMYLSCDEGTEFEKYIWEEKCHKKEYQKVTQGVPDEKKKTIWYNFFPEDFTEDDGNDSFECKHKREL